MLDSNHGSEPAALDATTTNQNPRFNRRSFLRFGVAGVASLLAPSPLRHRSDASKVPRASDGHGDPLVPRTTAWAGDATQTSVEISAHSSVSTPIGLAVSLSPDMSNATRWPSVTPNTAGWTKWSVSGLSPDVQYYHRLTRTPPGGQPQFLGRISRFRTLRPVGAPCTIRIAAGSCERTTPACPAAFDDMVAWGPDRMVHLGDFGYPGDLTKHPDTHMRNWALNCTDAGIREIQEMGCMDYIVSDHDCNGDGVSNRANYHDPVTKANLAAWRAVVPARMEDVQQPAHGRWRSEVEGNVRFVKLDTRSIDKTDTTDPSVPPCSPDSTMLGATQLGWLLSQIDAAVAARQLVVVFSDCAWNGISPGPPIPRTFSDKWPSYRFERDRISDYAATVGAHLFIVFGDSHGLQQDDGTNEKNGFASICCGPLDRDLHMHYQDSYQWNYPPDVRDDGEYYRDAQQYQRLTITQPIGSTTITVIAEARDCSIDRDDTPRTVRTMTKSYSM